MATQRELVAAMLLALSNDAYTTGFARAETWSIFMGDKPELEAHKLTGKGSLEPNWIVAAVIALPEAFVLALRESPNREKFMEAADIFLKNSGVTVEKEGPSCQSEKH